MTKTGTHPIRTLKIEDTHPMTDTPPSHQGIPSPLFPPQNPWNSIPAILPTLTPGHASSPPSTPSFTSPTGKSSFATIPSNPSASKLPAISASTRTPTTPAGARRRSETTSSVSSAGIGGSSSPPSPRRNRGNWSRCYATKMPG